MIQKEQRNFIMRDGKKVHAYLWTDTDIKPTQSIVLVHGMAEHIDRYEGFARNLVANGFAVIGYNERGHRYTDEKENYGYMKFNDLVEDVNEVIDFMKTKFPECPVNLFGHSMGSFVSERVCELYGDKLRKAVFCGNGHNSNLILNLGAFFCSVIKLFKGDHHRSKFIDGMAFGSFNKPFNPARTPLDWLNRDDKEVDKYIEDEWCGGMFTLRYYHDFFKGCVKVNNNIKNIPLDLPMLLVSGANDPVGNMGKGVKQVYDKLIKTKHTNVEMKLYDDARHEILLELNKEEVHKDIIDFLLK